jgi:hypothetical protein
VQIILQRVKLFLVARVASKEEAFRSDDAMFRDADDYVDRSEAGALVERLTFFGQRSMHRHG